MPAPWSTKILLPLRIFDRKNIGPNIYEGNFNNDFP